MKLNSEEINKRNEYIGMLNALESQSMKSTSKEIENPYTILKRKVFEIEDEFYKHNKTYYTESKLGSLIDDYFLSIVAEMLLILSRIIMFDM